MKEKLQEEYQRILGEYAGEIQTDTGSAADRRIHPRLQVKSKDLWISTVPEFELLDMSAAGLAIRSNQPLKPGDLFHVALGDLVSVNTEVISCQMAHGPDEYTDGEFRIQCRFLEELKGMELLVKAIRGN